VDGVGHGVGAAGVVVVVDHRHIASGGEQVSDPQRPEWLSANPPSMLHALFAQGTRAYIEHLEARIAELEAEKQWQMDEDTDQIDRLLTDQMLHARIAELEARESDR